MKKPNVLSIMLVLLMISVPVSARDAARDLARLVGYTIIASDSISEVLTNNYSEKYVKLSGGSIFKVDFLLLDPLPLTDIIVFAKSLPAELVAQYKGKLPERMLYSYKLLIDNEIFDATPK